MQFITMLEINEAQVVRARVDDLHLEAWNVITGDLALRDTDRCRWDIWQLRNAPNLRCNAASLFPPQPGRPSTDPVGTLFPPSNEPIPAAIATETQAKQTGESSMPCQLF